MALLETFLLVDLEKHPFGPTQVLPYTFGSLVSLDLSQPCYVSWQGRRNRYGHYGYGRTTFSEFHLYNRAVNVTIIPLNPALRVTLQ